MPSETPMTASLTLLGLGLKLRRRWKAVPCWVGRGFGFDESEVVVVLSSFGLRVWDSSSMVVEGSIVVLVLVLVFDDAIAPCSCQRGLRSSIPFWRKQRSSVGRRYSHGYAIT